MKYTGFLLLLLACLAASAAEPSKSPVALEYISPEKFTDMSSTDHGPPNQGYLDQFRKHVVKKAATYLAPGEQLRIEIKDIDMAGGFEPWNTPGQSIRMVRHIYPPRIELSYQWCDAAGNVVREGSERLTDLLYQMRSVPDSSDVLRYEKALMDDWLAKLFAGRDSVEQK
ncbi:DUF3016 domain-containing protein [Methylobacillus sp.]|uniref:DUF3016 domain-containing protein n=1 Tax=Methylobacillus sp. TaxID=56818 RepID=UPI002FE3A306